MHVNTTLRYPYGIAAIVKIYATPSCLPRSSEELVSVHQRRTCISSVLDRTNHTVQGLPSRIFGLGGCPRMPFFPSSASFQKNNARNINHMAVLIFLKFLDLRKNCYSRTASLIKVSSRKKMEAFFFLVNSYKNSSFFM
jgi:hypothetical protein